MKTDVANVQLDQTRKVSYGEFSLIAIVLLTATKFCSLPSVVAGAAGSKAIWVIAILAVIESVVLFFATKIAKTGGLFGLGLKKQVLVGLAALYLGFFVIKLSAFTREISAYYALSLFENIPVLPVATVFLIACALLSSKGFAGIGRVLEIFMWLFVFVFLFILIFTTATGDAFNAIAMFNPDSDGFGKGILYAFAWFGDSAVICFSDLSGCEKKGKNAKSKKGGEAANEGREDAKSGGQGSKERGERRTDDKRNGDGESGNTEEAQGGGNEAQGGNEEGNCPNGGMSGVRHKKKIAFAAVFFSLALLLSFYALFTSIYGDSAEMTDFAFIKLSSFKANSDELGSADWPLIILWAIIGFIYISLILLSGRECLCALRSAAGMRVKKDYSCFVALGIVTLAITTVFLDEEGDLTAFMTKFAGWAAMGMSAVTAALGIYALFMRKERKNDATN